MNDAVEIIVVEDDPLYQTLYADELCAIEANVSYCSNLAAADLLIHDMPPDAIIVDLSLPDGDGTQIVEKLATSESGTPPMIIVVTAHTDAQRLAAVERAGAQRVITKPFEAGAIQSALATLPMRRLLG